MIRRALGLTLAVLALGAAACGRGSGGDGPVGAGGLTTLATEQALEPRRFTATSVYGGHELVVDGIVEDDYRYAATVKVDGTPTYEEVVVDDARYVRVLDAARLMPPEEAAPLVQESPALAQVLSGGWVVDPAGAPVEFGGANKPLNVPLVADVVLERVRYLEQLPELLKSGFREYNTDAIYYLPKDDKFPPHKEDGTRFDSIPGGYDATAITATVSQLRPYFEYVSVWAQRSGITRVERLMQLPDPRDDKYSPVYRQLRQAGSRRVQNMIELGEKGRTVRETYLVHPAGDSVVTVPENATPVRLAALLVSLQQRVSTAASPSPLYGRLE